MTRNFFEASANIFLGSNLLTLNYKKLGRLRWDHCLQ